MLTDALCLEEKNKAARVKLSARRTKLTFAFLFGVDGVLLYCVGIKEGDDEAERRFRGHQRFS